MYLATSILVPNTWFYGPNDWSITVLGYLYIGSQHMVLWSKCLKNNSVLGFLYIGSQHMVLWSKWLKNNSVLGYLYIGSQHMVLWSKCLKNNSVLGYLYIVNYNILVQFYFNKYVHVQNELLSIC